MQKALKAGADDVATEVIARSGELNLRVSKTMLKKAAARASKAHDLDALEM